MTEHTPDQIDLMGPGELRMEVRRLTTVVADLLAACEATMDCCKHHGGKLSPHAIFKLREAITKATGEPQSTRETTK